jgi:hypothetical protein
MHALHIAPARLQKAFPHRICVRFSEQEDCPHKRCIPIATERLNQMVQSMIQEMEIKTFCILAILFITTANQKNQCVINGNVIFAGGTFCEQAGNYQEGIDISYY